MTITFIWEIFYKSGVQKTGAGFICPERGSLAMSGVFNKTGAFVPLHGKESI
jgi:hypothetical protein